VLSKLRFGERLRKAQTETPRSSQFSILVQSPADLLIASQALTAHGSMGWATLIGQDGPVWVPLSEVPRYVHS
jgi:hypothetical protein